MGKNQPDRRVRKTKQQLRQSLLYLLAQKPLKDITVWELTELADLNRATFYLHYRDVFDMLDQIENETLLKLQEIFADHPTYQGGPSPLLNELFDYLAKNKAMVLAFLGRNGSRGFYNKLQELIRDNCFANWANLFNKNHSENFEIFYAFVLSGCIGLLQHWLEANDQKTPQEMAELTEAIICKGINVLV